MPTYRRISITLHSQYDAAAIPEFAPRLASATPSPKKDGTIIFTPPTPNVADVLIPTYPHSQFWITYICPEPTDFHDPDFRFFYFKLFRDGRCVLSWGAGEENGWCGRVAFGIFDGGTDFEGRKLLEKRGFFFPGEGQEGGKFEIQVFRAIARKREPLSHGEVVAEDGMGFSIRNAGRLHKGERKRRYTYALADPTDKPYATFRYQCCSSEHLERIGCSLAAAVDSGIPVDDLDDLETLIATPPHGSPARTIYSSPPTSSPPAPAIPRDNLTMSRRLSFPPRLHLAPTGPRPEPRSPSKRAVVRDDGEALSRMESLSLAVEKPLPIDPAPAESSSEHESKRPSTPPPPTWNASIFPSQLRGMRSLLRRRSSSRDEKVQKS